MTPLTDLDVSDGHDDQSRSSISAQL